MARTGWRVPSATEDQGKRPQGIQPHTSTRRSTRLRRQPAPESDQPLSSPTNKIPSQQGCATPSKRGTKRPLDAFHHDPDFPQKRPRPCPELSPVDDTLDGTTNDNGGTYEPINPIHFWAREGQWPQEFLKPAMEHLLARKRSLSFVRKRSNSATSTTPSDQKPREEKTALYRDPRYETLLGTKGSFMIESSLDITSGCKILSRTLLEADVVVPKDSLFRDDVFKSTYQKIHNRNEARVVQDVTRLIVPSAESLATFGAKHLDILIESVNEGWNNSIPLTATRPQPDYSVGFRREAFIDDQLAKLSLFIGDFIIGDQSFFMGTYYMHFPFLTCEVKCGAAALDVADRQNAHSTTLAARAVVELFRLVKREAEVHREILAFSISHDYCSVRIYGCYPVIDGKNTKYYRYPIHKFDFTALNGRDRWTTYRFTKNVYDIWMPQHFKRLCSAIDQLPSNPDFNVPSLAGTGLSQSLESHGLSQSDVDSASLPEEDNQSVNVEHRATPDTSFPETGGAKRRKGKTGR
ncbi:hypothetical protein OCS_04953 [Ophiocordyceps sinensis CO18]|nr:hypothetical protein OCS_04953 [Ophiocordyceps sinensis CO18]